MNNSYRKDNDDTFVDENGKKWHKIHSKDYVVMTDDELLAGTVTLFSTGEHGWFRYVDVEHGIEADKHWSKFTARIYFEELIELHLGKNLLGAIISAYSC